MQTRRDTEKTVAARPRAARGGRAWPPLPRLGLLGRLGLLAAILATASVWPLARGTTATAQSGTSFHLVVSETTTVVPCPPPAAGTLCAQGGGPGQSVVLGPVTESFTSTIDPTHPDPVTGSWPVVSTVTLTSITGPQLVLHSQGSYNAVTGADSETFQVFSGTGYFAPVIGSGTAQSVTTGQSGATTYSTTTYDGTLTNYLPPRAYFPFVGG